MTVATVLISLAFVMIPALSGDRTGIEVMRPIAAAHGVSIAQIALAYLLHKPAVTSVIIGARTDEQLADNLAAVKVTLAADELAALDKVSALPPEYPGWMTEFQQRDRFLDGMDKA